MLSISFNNSVCVRIIVYKVIWHCVRTFQLLEILYTHLFLCNWFNSLLTAGRNSSCLGLTTRDAADTHEADNSGRNWYTWSRQFGTQLIHMKQTTRDATDTHEADTSGRNWYNFLTAGRNSYFPFCISWPFKRRVKSHLPPASIIS